MSHRRRQCWLSILVATEIGRQGVMLNSLVQHESEQTGSVGHSSPDITLLFKELVQLIPLWGEKKKNMLILKRKRLINGLSEIRK